MELVVERRATGKVFAAGGGSRVAESGVGVGDGGEARALWLWVAGRTGAGWWRFGDGGRRSWLRFGHGVREVWLMRVLYS